MWTRVLFFACVMVAITVAAPARAESDAEAAARLRAELDVLIGGARCNNLVHCRVIGLGARPCGGNEEHVAYSIWNTDGEEIRTRAMEYNFLREEMMAQSGLSATCEVLLEPRAACINARCLTLPAER